MMKSERLYKRWLKSGSSVSDRDLDLLLLTNAYRLQEGKKPLYEDPEKSPRFYIVFDSKTPRFPKGKTFYRSVPTDVPGGGVIFEQEEAYKSPKNIWTAFPVKYDYEKNRWSVPSDYYDQSFDAYISQDDPKIYLGIGSYNREAAIALDDLDIDLISDFKVIKQIKISDLYHSYLYGEFEITDRENPPVYAPVTYIYKSPGKDPEIKEETLTYKKISEIFKGAEWNRLKLANNLYVYFTDLILPIPEENAIPNAYLKDIKVFGRNIENFDTAMIPNRESWRQFILKHQEYNLDIDPRLIKYYDQYYSTEKKSFNLEEFALKQAKEHGLKLNLFRPDVWPPFLGPIFIAANATKKEKFSKYPWPWNKYYAEMEEGPEGSDFTDLSDEQIEESLTWLNKLSY